MDLIESRHKKELKWLDQEKRAALKKIKGTAGKGKKAKELLAAAEAEFEQKLRELQQRHETELKTAAPAENSCEPNNNDSGTEADPSDERTNEQEARLRRQEKARRKREKAKEKERERERQIAEETENAGPSPRDIENEAIVKHLDPLNLQINEVAADGHCLYRAIALQSARDSEDYPDIRTLCADTLSLHEDDFAPFCEFTDTVPDFMSYVERIRSSADWGGHLELRVLAMALDRPIWVYSATGTPQPMVIEPAEQGKDNEPLKLSYHRHYYALGEHYNEVVSKEKVS